MFGDIRPGVKNLLHVASNWTANQTFTRLDQGTTPQSQIKLRTTTRSASGAQQVSPATEWEGQGWSTTGSGSSIPVNYRAYILPVQAANAYGSWKLQYSNNNAAYSDALTHYYDTALARPFFTVNGLTTISADNSSTIDTLQTLNVSSTGNQNHVVMTMGSTIRAGWSVNSSGTVEYRAIGTSPIFNFNLGGTITSQTLIGQIYSNGYYSSYSGYFGAQVTAGSPDTSVQTSLSTYGSFAVRGVLVNSASYTLAHTETFVYCDPSNANFCTGTPVACNTYVSEATCNAKSVVGCSWFAGYSCSTYNGDSSNCNGTSGCTWEQLSCSSANNTSQSTCEALDDAYGGSCAWDTSTCPGFTTIATCQAQSGCTANTSNCNAFDGQSQGTCEGNVGCTWTGAACSAFDGTDQTTCESGHTGCTWNSGANTCDGVYDEGSTCSGSYLTSCTGDLCSGTYATGNCTGTYGTTCQGTADCNNLTDDGQTACNAESGCSWQAGINIKLPLSANSLRGTTGRIYSVVHVGTVGTCTISGQTNENVYQYGASGITLYKPGDKVLLHNQNISFTCTQFSTQSPCQAQSGCTWNPVVVCSSFNGNESGCTGSGVCSWNSGDSTCSGAGNPTANCSGNFTTTNRWYIHSLERGLSYVAKTTNYTLTEIDDVVDCTSGTFTLTLPSAALMNGKTFYLKNTGTGTITLNTTSSQTIDGNASGVLTLTTGDSMTVVSNNSNWVIV